MNTDRRAASAIVAICLLWCAPAMATPITDKYAELGGASGFLGAPTGPETAARDGVGRYQHFAGGSIYWHPNTGAHEVHGLIRARFRELGWEAGYLGYPMTDEILTFDRGGRVSKFQGGELIWRSATNKVSEVKSTDLVVDLPFPSGQPWQIIQANAASKSDSHGGPWAFCWDFMLAGTIQAQSNGRLFVAAADGPVIHAEQSHDSGGDSNVVIQRWGSGRYASYLHIKKDSYSRRFRASGSALPQTLAWNKRPQAKSGDVLAEVGDTGAAAGAYHLHFCVTTKPDRNEFAPFESVPVAFRNYSVSTDGGKTWTFVAVGVPRLKQWVRRENRPGLSAPQVNAAASVLNFGRVKGQISVGGTAPGQASLSQVSSSQASSEKPETSGGEFAVGVFSAWDEPLAATTFPIAAGSAGPWSYEIVDAPAFNRLKVTVFYRGSGGGAWEPVGDSGLFELRPSASATVNVQLRTLPNK
jgi:LGFP repeat